MKRTAGLSLIELLTALMILSILCGFGMSCFVGLLNRNQEAVLADEIKQAIQFAKIQALTHDRTLTLAPLSEDADWSKGMRLFEDNQTHQYTTHSTLIREWRWHAKAINVTWHGFESTTYLRFTPALLTRGANGQFIVQDGKKHQIKLILNRLARVREERS